MRLLGRYIFREILTSAVLGTLLATFVIFLREADKLFAVLVGSNNTSSVHRGGVASLGDAAGAAAHHSVRRAGGHFDRARPDGVGWRDHRHARGGRLQPEGDRASDCCSPRWG